MNILFLYDSPLFPEAGGTERATKLVMDELSRRGHKTIGLLHSKRTDPDRFCLNNKPIDSLCRFLKDNKVDVVVNQIAFHYWLLYNFLSHGGFEWGKNGGKIISFMHLDPTPAPHKKIKFYFEDWEQKTIWGKIKRLLLILYIPILNYKSYKEYKYSLRYIYDNSNKYILMSKSFKDIFLDLSGIKKAHKLAFITNMLTFPDIESPEILKKKEKIVLVVARLDDEQKNISFIIDVWKSLKNHRGYALHIIGSGKDGIKLRQKAAGVEHIFFDGAQNPLEWYRKSKIFLMASPREGWGLTLTESLQNGVVPVTMNTSTVFKDIIINGENGYLADNRKEYIDYLSLLMNDELHLQAMAIKGLNSANRFSAKSVGDNWDKLLSEFDLK